MNGKRPGGLTALAILNFIMAGMGLLATLGIILVLAISFGLFPESMTDKSLEKIQAAGTPVLFLVVFLGFLTTALQMIAGVGYLRLKKFLGRTLGNAYAITAIAQASLQAMIFGPEMGGGFQLGTIAGLVYPVFTLLLLNTTFRRDLIH